MLDDQGVPRSTYTSADTMAPLDDSSIHDRLDKVSPLVDQTHIKFADVSYCGSVNFLLQWAYTPDAIVFRSDEFGSHSVGEMMSGTFCFRIATVSRARCASAPSC